MVLGLYYITKGRKSEKDASIRVKACIFYSPEEVIIAFNERRWTSMPGSRCGGPT
ncbi:MAG: hypothetical protein LKM36_06885 [Flavobacteriales bacterium]|nr:hypothetical protein [Flavobacteriales bacterium]